MPPLRTLGPRLAVLDTRTVKPKTDIRTGRAVKATDPFYGSAEWQAFRKAVVAERGRRCEDCGSTTGRVYCDHIVELRDGGAPLDWTNIRLRCATCHVRKTGRARGDRMRS